MSHFHLVGVCIEGSSKSSGQFSNLSHPCAVIVVVVKSIVSTVVEREIQPSNGTYQTLCNELELSQHSAETPFSTFL